MSKLALAHSVPREYDAASMQSIVRQVEQQANKLAEGSITARHGAMTAAPTTGNWVKGDTVDNSNPSVVVDVVDYVLMGWICTASGAPGTWKERRVLVENQGATLGTEVAATSGTSIDFTGIPSWVKKITINLVGVSLSGAANPLIQIGDSGGIETSGYLGAGTVLANGATVIGANFTAGFGFPFGSGTDVLHGSVVLTLEDATQFTWIAHGVLGASSGAVCGATGGSKSTSAALDRVRITTSNGTDTFDAGAINILME